MTGDLFAPPELEWTRIDRGYLKLRRLIIAVVPPLLFSVPAVLVGVLAGLWWLSAIFWVGALVYVVLRWIFVARTWRSWGYLEREEDLYITHGRFFRVLTAVPYGRMQVVEVTSGPLQRAFGISTIELKTASPETDATIPGLAPAESVRLRDRLTELGHRHAAAL